VFALWTFANWLIMGNPLFWYQGQKAEAVPPPGASWLPVHRTLVNGARYAAGYTWAFVPALVVILPIVFVVVLRRRRRLWELATILGAAAIFPGQVALGIAAGTTWGDPRYFASLTIFSTVVLAFATREVLGAGWLARPARWALCLVLVCLAGYNAVSGTRNDLDPDKTAVESEYVAFRAAFGLPLPSDDVKAWRQPAIVTWHSFDDYIDPYLAKGQLIMCDTGSAFPAVLFSREPRQWVIPSDRDFQSLADNFSGQFQWLLKTPSSVTNFSSTPEIDQALSSTDGGHWRLAKDFLGVGELYHWAPDRTA
jgi:hypothetical protein